MPLFKYKDILTKEFLKQEYIIKRKTILNISEEQNIPEPTIFRYLKSYKIKGRTLSDYRPYKDILTKKFLLKEYVANHRSALKISKQLDCSDGAILYALHLFNISRNKYTGIFHSWYGRKHSLETRKKFSKIHKNKNMGKDNPMYGKRAKPKKYSYNGILMRSTWEVKYARYLDENKIKWEYESKTFNLGNCTYTPDFYLPKMNEYIEIKGYWKNGYFKIDLFKKLYPYIKYKVLYEQDLKKLGIKRLRKGSVL